MRVSGITVRQEIQVELEETGNTTGSWWTHKCNCVWVTVDHGETRNTSGGRGGGGTGRLELKWVMEVEVESLHLFQDDCNCVWVTVGLAMGISGECGGKCCRDDAVFRFGLGPCNRWSTDVDVEDCSSKDHRKETTLESHQ